jgi:putative dimethyl sulfoxide reductase chaperone
MNLGRPTVYSFVSGGRMLHYDLEKGIARADLGRFLAACYYQPGPEFSEEKVFDSMLDAATRIHPDLAAQARRLGEHFSTEEPESLLVDYTRLFLGPPDTVAKPYGSVWLDGETTLMGNSTMAVQELYHEGGFEIDEAFRELPDHIVAELEFLYLLIYRENEGHRNGSAEALKAVALKKRFLNEHLGRWIGPFTAAVKSGARSSFYRELAGLTDRFVEQEKEAR